MWRKRKQHREEPVGNDAGFGTGVGDECEAYLAGQLAAYLRGTRRSVPPAGWLNQVVHATTNELALLAVGTADRMQAMTWPGAVGYLARTLLDRARETGRPIDELQVELLLPLELELLGRPDAVDFGPADLIRLTLVRLYEVPELPA
jgi:hypothetical protein